MGWNMESITKERREKASSLVGLGEVALIERIIALESVLVPFTTTLGSLDDKLDWHRAGMHLSSKLWPLRDATSGKMLVFNREARKSEEIEDPAPERLHEVEYYTEDSLTFDKDHGGKLHDDFEIIGVHQQALAAYIYCGNITMEDVRRAVKALNGCP